MIGSPTALADEDLYTALLAAATTNGVYIPSGALWGAQDIQKMARGGKLKDLTVTMKKHPGSMKLNPPLSGKLAEATTADGETVLYDGPVRALCAIAPNNVNTMAAAAIAFGAGGFDKTRGVLVADPSLQEHIVEVLAEGVTAGFQVATVRRNPAPVGAVTGTATYASFCASMQLAKQRGPGLHLC
mmetsp:Transcript_70779/g.166918  ORF Transcript_70779/g.166918 Transcript_70779/m.166918 type:complete len:186 (+) Transcript_70779:354-911(+)